MPNKDSPKFISIGDNLDLNIEHIVGFQVKGNSVIIQTTHGTLGVSKKEYLEAKKYYGIGD